MLRIRWAISWLLHTIVWFLSGEFVLRTWWHRCPNGGTVVFLRAVIVSSFMYGLAYWLTSPSNGAVPALPLTDLHQLKASPTVFGAIFAGVYAAFHTRFSSQWVYLAGVYNQIKAIEAQTAATTAGCEKAKAAVDAVLASWKAGFIEDADDLHLALKPTFAVVIDAWARNKKVYHAFVDNTLDGKERLDKLLREIGQRLDERARGYK